MRELFLWRAAATLIAPWVILWLVAESLRAAPATAGLMWGGALACCLVPIEGAIPWRGGRAVIQAAALVGLAVILAGVLCLALVSLPFFAQRASFLRWGQEET
jgi:hypothetical protein